MNEGELFWRAENQHQRLDELAGVPAEIKEEPLRRDVRSLGHLLGLVIQEQEGQRLFEIVESLRRFSIKHRTDGSGFEPAQEIVRNASVGEASKLAKAFGIYFELTNLAETNHRKRRRRAAQMRPKLPPQPGTFRGTLLRIRDAGIGTEQLLQSLRRIMIRPVFTAHP